jgi:hypothetical protein
MCRSLTDFFRMNDWARLVAKVACKIGCVDHAVHGVRIVPIRAPIDGVCQINQTTDVCASSRIISVGIGNEGTRACKENLGRALATYNQKNAVGL